MLAEIMIARKVGRRGLDEFDRLMKRRGFGDGSTSSGGF